MTDLMVSYSAAHEALVQVGRRHALAPFDVRMLVRLDERGGEARTDDLEDDLACITGTMVRRSSLGLRAAGYIVADHGAGTVGTKRGVRARFTLTDRGRQVVAQFRAALPLSQFERDIETLSRLALEPAPTGEQHG